MNQIQTLIESIKDAPHDALIVAGVYALPVVFGLWIVNRMRHPQRGYLNALVIASVGFVLVPWVSSMVLVLWVRTGGSSLQATCISIFIFVGGYWALRGSPGGAYACFLRLLNNEQSLKKEISHAHNCTNRAERRHWQDDRGAVSGRGV